MQALADVAASLFHVGPCDFTGMLLLHELLQLSAVQAPFCLCLLVQAEQAPQEMAWFPARASCTHRRVVAA